MGKSPDGELSTTVEISLRIDGYLEIDRIRTASGEVAHFDAEDLMSTVFQALEKRCGVEWNRYFTERDFEVFKGHEVFKDCSA